MDEKEKVDFDIIISNIRQKKYRFIGSGSGRRVFDLENGYVVKVAKNIRGFAQNKVECHISSEDQTPLFAKITDVSDDFRLLIMEKAELINNIFDVWEYFGVKNKREFYKLDSIQYVLTEYDLIFADLCRPVNWGMIGEHPVIIDYGFTSIVKRKYYSLF